MNVQQTLIDDFWVEENKHLKESTWMGLAKKELLNSDIHELLSDNQNNLDSEDDVIEEIRNKIDIPDFEPSEEQFEELKEEILKAL